MTDRNTARLRRVGNSVGSTFSRDTLAVTGFNEGDRVLVHAEPGRIELRRHDERTAKFDAWWERFEQRYRRTLHELAK